MKMVLIKFWRDEAPLGGYAMKRLQLNENEPHEPRNEPHEPIRLNRSPHASPLENDRHHHPGF